MIQFKHVPLIWGHSITTCHTGNAGVWWCVGRLYGGVVTKNEFIYQLCYHVIAGSSCECLPSPTVGQLSHKSDPSEKGWGYPSTQVFEHMPRRVWQKAPSVPARALKPQPVYLSFAAFLQRKAPRLTLVSPSAQGLLTLTRVALLFDSFYHMLTGAAQSRSCSSAL